MRTHLGIGFRPPPSEYRTGMHLIELTEKAHSNEEVRSKVHRKDHGLFLELGNRFVRTHVLLLGRRKWRVLGLETFVLCVVLCGVLPELPRKLGRLRSCV